MENLNDTNFNKRLKSINIFRGLTIFTMIIVNSPLFFNPAI